MTRETKINSLYLPDPISIGGKSLKALSMGRKEMLRQVGNPLLDRQSNRNQSAECAMGEMAYVMTLTPEECAAYRRLSESNKIEIISNFMLAFEDEIEPALAAINDRIHSNDLAGMENMTGGKGEQVHAFSRSFNTSPRRMDLISMTYFGSGKLERFFNFLRRVQAQVARLFFGASPRN